VENIIEPAAKKGDVGAIQVVGECFQHGLGGKKEDEKTAQEYYEKGASAGSPSSQCSLGVLLLEQDDDDEKAKERGVELLKKSAASECPEAQHELAICEWNGSVSQKTGRALLNCGRRLPITVLPNLSISWLAVSNTVLAVWKKTLAKLRTGI
jgi:TPR repeat protein